MDLLKAEAQRQISITRQEIVSDLITVYAAAREPTVRKLLVRLIETNLRSGLVAAKRTDDLWPELQEAEAMIEEASREKPSTARKHRKLFEQLDRVQGRSLKLLHDSFDNIQLILDRMQVVAPLPSPAAPNPKPAAPAAKSK